MFIYRMYKNNPNIQLDPRLSNKFGINEVGKSKWKKMNDKEQRDTI